VRDNRWDKHPQGSRDNLSSGYSGEGRVIVDSVVTIKITRFNF